MVYWEERITRLPAISSSIRDFESGRIEFKISNVTFTALGEDWEYLLDTCDFVGGKVKAYIDGSPIFEAFTNGYTASNGAITVIVKNQTTELDSECHWGDPDYLNRIDGTYNSTYYNAASIPEKFYGKATPFIIGDRMAYAGIRQGSGVHAS